MKINGRRITDDEITVDPSKAVEAYERFQALSKRSDKPSETDKGGPAHAFNKAIKSKLEMFEADHLVKDWYLGSKQTFSAWRTAPPKSPQKKKRSVLLAVLSLTGVDISAQGILARNPVNLSPMSELGSLKSRKLTNNPDEVDEVTFEIELSELMFKGAEMTVMSDWVLSDGKLSKTGAFEVGTVVFGLKEADIEINFGDTEPVDWVRRISPDTDPFLGRADGCVIIWSQERSSWTIQPTEGSPMRVRVENVKLCQTRGRRGAFVELMVTAFEDQMYSDFKMRRELNAKGETQPSRTGAPLGDQLIAARERLFSIVLAHRREATAVLSFQRHKLP